MEILFADDHDLVRDGIKPFLEELDDNVRVVEAVDYESALAAARDCPDLNLILLDLDMPGMNGMSGIETFVREFPEVPVVILSGHFHRDDITSAMAAGIQGYIPKTIGGGALVNALRLVLSGEKYVPSSLLSNDAVWTSRIQTRQRDAEIEGRGDRLKELSNREREILGYLVEGKTNKEIANQLDLMEITVKIHVRNVYRKIGAANRAMAVRIAMESGWNGN